MANKKKAKTHNRQAEEYASENDRGTLKNIIKQLKNEPN